MLVNTRKEWETVCSIVLSSAERCGLLGWGTRWLEIFERLEKYDEGNFPGYGSEELQLVVDQYLGEVFELNEFSLALPVTFAFESVFNASKSKGSAANAPIHEQFLEYWDRWATRNRWIGHFANNPEVLDDPIVFADGNLTDQLASEDRNPIQHFDWEVIPHDDPGRTSLVSIVPSDWEEDLVLGFTWDASLSLAAWKVRHFLDTEFEAASQARAVFVEQNVFDDGEEFSPVTINFVEDPSPEEEAPRCFVIENQIFLRDDE